MGITIGGWIAIGFGIVILLGGIAFGIATYLNKEVGMGITYIVLSLVLGLSFVLASFIFSRTESGKRAYKDQQSNFNNGIERIVEVYDVNGNLIKSYEGRFDVATSEEGKYIKFDDENGKRRMIYYTTGTVIVEEK